MPLAHLATVGVARGPNTISRENVQRKIMAQANVAGRNLGGLLSATALNMVVLPALHWLVEKQAMETPREPMQITDPAWDT